MKHFSLAIVLIICSPSLNWAQEMNGSFFDPRDGQEYETVFVNVEVEKGIVTQQEWMMTNLNYETDGSFCYKNYKEYCNSFGRLYTWKTAVNICPSGWHMSLDMEWQLVTKKYGGHDKAGPYLIEGGESGINLQPAGFGEQNGTYIDVGVNGYYWKKQSKGSTTPGTFTIHRGVDYITDDQVDETHKNSVRCVRDY